MGNKILPLEERLKHLMKTRGIKNGADLANKMKEKGIDLGISVDSASRTINLHLEGKPIEEVNGKWIKRYADFFGCSLDYLFGYIDTPNHEMNNVALKTGFSEEVISVLLQSQQSTPYFNELLDSLVRVLSPELIQSYSESYYSLCSIKQTKSSSNNKPTIDSKTGTVALSVQDSKAYYCGQVHEDIRHAGILAFPYFNGDEYIKGKGGKKNGKRN